MSISHLRAPYRCSSLCLRGASPAYPCDSLTPFSLGFCSNFTLSKTPPLTLLHDSNLLLSCTIILHILLYSPSLSSVQFSSVAQSCLTLCDPMNCSTRGLPVHHHLPEFTQTHIHRVSDAIQPSHPLSSPSPPAPNPSQVRVFSNESTLRMRWPKYWSFSFSISPSKEHPGLISFRMDWLDFLAV